MQLYSWNWTSNHISVPVSIFSFCISLSVQPAGGKGSNLISCVCSAWMGATNAVFLIKDCWATTILEGDLAIRDKFSSSYGTSTWLNSTEQKHNYHLHLENILLKISCYIKKYLAFLFQLHFQFPFEDFTFKIPFMTPYKPLIDLRSRLAIDCSSILILDRDKVAYTVSWLVLWNAQGLHAC